MKNNRTIIIAVVIACFCFYMAGRLHKNSTQTVPIYTYHYERIFQTLDSFDIKHIDSDTVYGKMPYYGTERLNDSISIRFYGRMIGSIEIDPKYLIKPTKGGQQE